MADIAGKIAKGLLGLVDEAAAKAAIRQAESAGKKAKTRLKPGEFVRDRKRTAYPGIYKRPDEIAAEAAAKVAPESPALRELFGVTRRDLYDMSMDAPRVNPSVLGDVSGGRSEAAYNIMTPRNTQRMIDTLSEAQNYPELWQGMAGWYNLDPAYDVAKAVSNDPARAFRDFNAFSGMASPGSDVITELRRGTVARYLNDQGRFPDFAQYNVSPQAKGAPADMAHMPGHPYGGTAHGIPMEAYASTGEVRMKSPKVPPYIQSSLPAELGGTWTVPVGDAHFSRAVGLADTRGGAEPGKSISHAELKTLAPWWSDISRSVGLQEVPGQAVTWGVFAPQTGVETAVGVPKLELFANEVVRRAGQLGVEPRKLLEDIMAGRKSLAVAGAGMAAGGLLAQPDTAQAGELSPEEAAMLDDIFGKGSY